MTYGPTSIQKQTVNSQKHNWAQLNRARGKHNICLKGFDFFTNKYELYVCLAFFFTVCCDLCVKAHQATPRTRRDAWSKDRGPRSLFGTTSKHFGSVRPQHKVKRPTNWHRPKSPQQKFSRKTQTISQCTPPPTPLTSPRQPPPSH